MSETKTYQGLGHWQGKNDLNLQLDAQPVNEKKIKKTAYACMKIAKYPKQDLEKPQKQETRKENMSAKDTSREA